MELYIKELMLIQGELDARIFALHQTTRAKTRADRILALLVEVGECANETRVFKYWSLREASADEVIFEEFSDVVHFALSLGIDLDYKEESIHFEAADLSLSDCFHRLYRDILSFAQNNDKAHYERLLVSMCQTADKLGMDAKEIERRYLLKNKKNHKRQDDRY